MRVIQSKNVYLLLHHSVYIYIYIYIYAHIHTYIYVYIFLKIIFPFTLAFYLGIRK